MGLDSFLNFGTIRKGPRVRSFDELGIEVGKLPKKDKNIRYYNAADRLVVSAISVSESHNPSLMRPEDVLKALDLMREIIDFAEDNNAYDKMQELRNQMKRYEAQVSN